MQPRKPALGFIFVTVVLDVLGFGLLIPVAPRLVMSLINGGAGGTAAEAAPVVGMLMTTWYAMSFLFAPTLGNLSDRFGRRPILLVALLGSGLDFFAQALAPTIGWFFITRAINGLSGASMTVANAYVADVTPPEKRGVAFGMLGAAFGIGFVIGPLLGGLLGGIDIRLPFYAAGALTLVNWMYGMFVLPESLPAERRRPLNWARANPLGAFHGLGRYPLVAGLAAALFLLNMSHFGLHATWVLYTGHRYGWGERMVGLSLFAVGVTTAIVQGGLARRLIPRLGDRRSLLLGLAVTVAAYIGYGMATQGWMIFVVIVMGSLAGIAQPAAQSMITRTVRHDEQGEIQGALMGMTSIAGILGPMIGSGVMHYAIDGPVPGANFLVSGALAVLGMLCAAWAVRHGVAGASQTAENPEGEHAADGLGASAVPGAAGESAEARV